MLAGGLGDERADLLGRLAGDRQPRPRPAVGIGLRGGVLSNPLHGLFVAPNHGAMPEMVSKTGGGVLVQPDDPGSFADGLMAIRQHPGQARVGITRLVAEVASLEDLFLGMTGGDSSDHDREAVAS